MNTETRAGNIGSEVKATKPVISGEVVIGLAVLGCLGAGGIGIFKAITADGVGAGLCLLASVGAFATVCYTYCRKS
jgi:hypothetical protein